MENMADALQIAAFTLIFIVALTISINAFGEARQSAQMILDNTDREYDYTYLTPVLDDANNIIKERTVRGETIVPAIYKAYKENYKIIFKKSSGDPMALYKKNGNEVHYIDLEKEVLVDDKQKERFIAYLLGGANKFNTPEDNAMKTSFRERGIELNLHSEGVYGIIKGKSFIERLGVYYQEELTGDSNTPNANKTKKRVITYQEV